MRITHLNCGTMCPLCRRLVNGDGSFFERGRMVCHSLLIDLDDGRSVLVDGGFGLGDCADRNRFPRMWRFQAAPRLDPSETAISQLEAMGRDPGTVRDIVLTHLDRDHCGAISDFPHARIHVCDREWRTVFEGDPPARPGRYIAQQFAHGPDFVRHAPGAEDWFGIDAVRPLGEVDILLVALHGHTPGHCGVAVRRGDGGWLLHAGDAFYQQRQLAVPPRPLPAGIAYFERKASENDAARAKALAALRRIASEHRDQVTIFCSHDGNGLPGVSIS